MNKNLYTPKTPRLFYILLSLLSFLLIEALYIKESKMVSFEVQNQRTNFVFLSGLPDLAISTEATYVRHRSMSDVFAIYKDDGSLREYFPSTYVYSHSHIINGRDNAK
jgi:hypothetical protein